MTVSEPRTIAANCPKCGNPLVEIRYPSDSMLNRDQWESQLPGDLFCTCHNNNRGNKPYAYFWKSEFVERAEPSRGAQRAARKVWAIGYVGEPPKPAPADEAEILQAAEIIDRESGHGALLEALRELKDASNSLTGTIRNERKNEQYLRLAKAVEQAEAAIKQAEGG